jgi:serine/threonine protein kinase
MPTNKGLIHRDIKPANVMIGPYGEVMLMDWGLAKRIGTHDARLAPGQSNVSPYNTLLGHAIGTPMYMPPEQARGEHDRCDARSDVYALSAVFFELMSLQSYLGTKRDVQEILDAVKSQPAPGPLETHPPFRHPPRSTPGSSGGISTPTGCARPAARARHPPGDRIALPRSDSPLAGDAARSLGRPRRAR